MLTPSSAVIRTQCEHASVRDFSSDPINPELLETLLHAGQSAPTSSFIQAYSVVRVANSDTRATIAEAAGGQRWIREAAEFLVFCADLSRVDVAARSTGQGPLEGWTEHGLQAIVDVSLMAQNVLLAAESVGLGGVFIGGIRNAPQVVAERLKLPRLVVPVFGMCLGWPAVKHAVKPRMPVDMVLHQDTYRPMDDDQLRAYDTRMAAYYRERTSNARQDDWSQAASSALQGKRRPHMLGFLHQYGFFLK